MDRITSQLLLKMAQEFMLTHGIDGLEESQAFEALLKASAAIEAVEEKIEHEDADLMAWEQDIDC